MKNKKALKVVIVIAVLIVVMIIAAVTTNTETVQKTFWALVPPIVAIGLALVTKEVYSSLFIGIVVGAALYAGFNFEGTIVHTFQESLIPQIADPGHIANMIFLILLGALVAMMNKSGGSAAFGRWSQTHIKTRAGAQIATIVLGILIFIDDYFNCLTVGSVMRPVTEKHNISKAKFSYLIDSTAAPICIIAPISSWAAAVTGLVEGGDGMAIFIQAIPFNFYALLTIFMLFALVKYKTDYGPMKIHEMNALKGDIYTTPDRPYANAEDDSDVNPKGTIKELVVPIIALIVACIIGMLYTGGFFAGTDLVTAFATCDAPVGLMYGAFFAFIFTMFYYMIRKVLPFGKIMECLPQGFKAMVPAMLILTFAWTLKAITDSLGAKEYVAELVAGSAGSFVNWLPAIIFVIAVILAFATGTSWGTFSILIPIVVAVFAGTDYQMMVISISACMAGAVCGDHCSPISDTTIMASAGAQCNHLNHVTTQLPYAITVAAISFVCYVIAGFTKNWVISLIVGAAMVLVVLTISKVRDRKNGIEES